MHEPERTPAEVAAAVLAAAMLLVAVAVIFSPRVGVLALSVFALAGAGARVVSPLKRAFIVRRRFVDVAVMVVLGVALGFLGLTTPL